MLAQASKTSCRLLFAELSYIDLLEEPNKHKNKCAQTTSHFCTICSMPPSLSIWYSHFTTPQIASYILGLICIFVTRGIRGEEDSIHCSCNQGDGESPTLLYFGARKPPYSQIGDPFLFIKLVHKVKDDSYPAYCNSSFEWDQAHGNQWISIR